MKTICIKTNNLIVLEYLLNELRMSNTQSICFVQKQFKNYKNIIIHYSGNDIKNFIHEVSCILSCLVIDELEENFLKNIILRNYFYFDSDERKQILEICFETFSDDFNTYFDKKYNCLINAFEAYLSVNKSIVLTGFVNFRIKDYLKILEVEKIY